VVDDGVMDDELLKNVDAMLGLDFVRKGYKKNGILGVLGTSIVLCLIELDSDLYVTDSLKLYTKINDQVCCLLKSIWTHSKL